MEGCQEETKNDSILSSFFLWNLLPKEDPDWWKEEIECEDENDFPGRPSPRPHPYIVKVSLHYGMSYRLQEKNMRSKP